MIKNNLESGFNALENHLNDERSKKSKDLEKVIENFGKDPYPRVKNFVSQFEDERYGIKLALATGQLAENFYSENNKQKLDIKFILETKLSSKWGRQIFYVRRKAIKSEEDFVDIIETELNLKYKNGEFEMTGIVESYDISKRRATGQMILKDVFVKFN